MISYKRKFTIVLVMSIFLSSFSVMPIFASDTNATLNVNARSAILIEPSTGKILLEQNANEKLPPASVTKIMTILLIYDSVASGKISWDDIVTISAHAASMGGSQIFLEPMEQQSVKDLTKSIVIASANDSAVAMAEFIAGSEEGFVLMMNQKAKDLNMNNTNFINACGLDEEGHLTTALDIALMTKELMLKYPDVKVYSKTWQDTIVHKTARGSQDFGLTNTNKLIRSYPAATGLKTGSTSKALYCLSGTAEKEGMELIAVILGAPDPSIRFHEVIKMFDYGFASHSLCVGEEAGTPKGEINILKGELDNVEVVIKDKVTALVTKGTKKTLDSSIEMLTGLNAPVLKGTKAGEIVYTFEGKEVGRSDLVTTKDVKVANISKILEKLLKKWFQFD